MTDNATPPLQALINKAVIKELEAWSEWINKGLAESYRIRRLKELRGE